MANGQWAVVRRHTLELFKGATVAGLTEGQILERFVADRDEIAFSAILARHGPMVLSVCRGVLNEPSDVDDAFQATFLVLVQKAQDLRDFERLGPWLYGVARRVALRSRSNTRRDFNRQHHLDKSSIDQSSSPSLETCELQEVVRVELDRLSDNDRIVLVLCYLEGLTMQEAADRLGWPLGTVKGRLSRAREKLRGRLDRRGLALPTIIIEHFGRKTPELVPASLIKSTAFAATRLAAGKELTAGAISAQTILLIKGASGTMFTAPLKIATAILLATSVAAIPSVIAYRASPTRVAQGQATPPTNSVALSQGMPLNVLDPETPESDVQIAERALDRLQKMMMNGEGTLQPDKVYLWSRRLVEARSASGTPENERQAALEVHLDRMRRTLDSLQKLVAAGNATEIDLLEFRYRVNEAQRWVREGRIQGIAARSAVTSQPSGGGGFGGPFGGGGFGDSATLREPLILKESSKDEQRNEAIRLKLEQPLTINFPEGTTLDEVKKFFVEKTRDPGAGFPNGIPMYFDPEGVQNAGKTMKSTVAISLQGIPIRTSLRLILHQLGLDFRVTSGLILISDQDSIKTQDPTRKPPNQENPADTRRNAAIEAKLELTIAMEFPNETTLAQVMKHIQESTRDEAAGFPKGIPIYVDPRGLQNAEKTIESRINLDLRDIPLRTTLRLLLRQVGLNYRVTGGLLLISDGESIKIQSEPEKRVLGFQ